MPKIIENNSVVLIDPDEESEVVAHLLLKMNAFVTIKTAEIVTTLDKVTQAEESLCGRFPELIALTQQGNHKAYRLQDIKKWLDQPCKYSF